MKITLPRRMVAAIASLGLALVALPVAAPAANAAEACGLGETCSGTLTGSLGETTFEIRMPARFNGTVLLYSHGYRIADPVPAIVGTRLQFDRNPFYSEVSIPALAAVVGSPTAYVGNNLAQVAPSTESAANLLSQGYALAGAGYARQGWAVAEGVEAGELLIRHINAGAVPRTRQVLAWGDSMGGLIAQTLAQRNPRRIAGTLPLCGALEGPEQAFSGGMTVMYAWKTLVDPSLKVANYAPGQAGYAQAIGDLLKVAQTLGQVAENPAAVSSVGFPVALANFLSGLLAGLPTKSITYDGLSVNPAVGTLGPLEARAQGFSPVTSGANSVAAMSENVFQAAALAIMGRFNLEQIARQVGQIPADGNSNFNDNVPVVYSSLLTIEQRREFEDTFASVSGTLLDTMLGALDATVGNAQARFPANPTAVAVVRGIPAAKAAYGQPTIYMTTAYDPIVSAGNTRKFFFDSSRTKAARDAQRKGMLKIGQYYTMPLKEDYTSFAPDAKAPSTQLSALAAGGSGVGHCTFTPAQHAAGVRALNALVRAKTPRAVTAAKRIPYSAPGVNRDRLFLPEPLKFPLATAR